MIQQKVEIRFQKGEAVRFISHHDLMRAIMRAVRRAHLPVRLTEGFNPRPRIVFPVALEVGVASLDEVAEIELTQCLDIQEVSSRLASVFPPGLTLTEIRAIPSQRTGRTPARIQYRIHLAETTLRVPPEAPAELLAATTLPFARKREKHIQNVDLRQAVLAIKVEKSGDLLLDVRPSPAGSARPLEVLSLLLKQPLDSLRQVRATKLLMEMSEAPTSDMSSPPPEPSPELETPLPD